MDDAFEETDASQKSASDYLRHSNEALHREPAIDREGFTQPLAPRVAVAPYDDGIDRIPLQLLAAPVECEPLTLYPDESLIDN
eukprot:2878775-Lingulodinium_polyedra.AAC.1